MTETKDQQSEGNRSSNTFQVKWPALGVVLSVVALGSLGTLAVVASVKGADTLSTVALALAILSFAAQLIVSMLQTHSNASINASTQSALAEVRATTTSLLSNQSDQYDKLLTAMLKILPGVVSDVTEVSTSSDSGELSEDAADSRVTSDQVRANIESALVESITSRLMTELSDNMTGRPRVVVNEERVAEAHDSDLDVFPSAEEGEKALGAFRQLPPLSLRRLEYIATKIRDAERKGEASRARYNRKKGKGRPVEVADLISRGLVEEIVTPDEAEGGAVVYGLTEIGRLVSRMLLPTGSAPKWLTALGNVQQDGEAVKP